MSSIADNLRTLRTLKRMTQAELSELSNVSKTYINRIEKGVYVNVSLDVLNKLSSALECTITDLNGDFELEKRANLLAETMLARDPDRSVSSLILDKLIKENLIDENFVIDDNLKKILEEAIKFDARINNNLKKKGSGK